MSKNEQAHIADLNRVNAAHHARVNELVAEMEAQRCKMQAEIDRLNALLE
jgi:hypothetical protein